MMLLYSFDLSDAHNAMVGAVGRAIKAGNRTGDIFSASEPNARKIGTREMGDAIAVAVRG
jgi:isocitrate dehydrogenase